jgi:D-threonate/D-erythronate kinase
MTTTLIIADDLTGAADTGLQFRRAGLAAHIRFTDSGLLPLVSSTAVEVVSTETRNASAEEAARVHRAVGAGAARDAPALLLKKIDSTLRGHIGVEIRALRDSLPERIAWIVPAYPKLGRRMENGVYTVNGIPLAATEFAREIPDIPADSRVLSLLQRQMGEAVAFIGAAVIEEGEDAITACVQEQTQNGTIRAVLFDAVTEAHIERIVAAGRRAETPLLWVGSAGLAGVLAKCIMREPTRADVASLIPYSAPVLVVAGSRNPVTRRQIAFLRAREMSLVYHVLPLSGPPFTCADGSDGTPRGILLSLPEAAPTVSPTETADAAARLGDAAAHLAAWTGSQRLILTGGDIAAATCRRLSVEAMQILGALEEGIPLLRLHGGAADGAFVVTKAGGFGTEESLYRAFKFLAGNA